MSNITGLEKLPLPQSKRENKSKTLKQPPDYKKVNKTRRSRGYNFEYDIVNAFNDHQSSEWTAKRLGGSSSGLPDIIVTNNNKSRLYAIECKSGESDSLFIPRDQIERCIDITNNFLRNYHIRFVVFAFKFKANKKKGRKLQYRFMIYEYLRIRSELKGVTYNIRNDEIIPSSQIPYIFEYNGVLELSSIDRFVNWI